MKIVYNILTQARATSNLAEITLLYAVLGLREPALANAKGLAYRAGDSDRDLLGHLKCALRYRFRSQELFGDSAEMIA